MDYVQGALDLAQAVLAKEGFTDITLQVGDGFIKEGFTDITLQVGDGFIKEGFTDITLQVGDGFIKESFTDITLQVGDGFIKEGFTDITLQVGDGFIALFCDRLVGLVARKRKNPGLSLACIRIFPGSSHTGDLKIGTPVATLPGSWRYRVSAGAGWAGVSLL